MEENVILVDEIKNVGILFKSPGKGFDICPNII
jgi:hypothetical protein